MARIILTNLIRNSQNFILWIGSNDDEDKYPLVFGFGDDAILGFGINPNLLNGRIIDIEQRYEKRVLDTLNRTMERYDKNKNGVLEHDEWSEPLSPMEPMRLVTMPMQPPSCRLAAMALTTLSGPRALRS